ncbi:MAG: hypothetical protein B7Z75_10165 [Acidocella sp. 20-57-95]|nr:MAG: hypothetical protein B7Z75_10165 [Acidocella sp. 20-57-95]OYV59908.1 MAG: hypothetical protein B7Z71_07090 [Acidocella sp. 21-58-7]HQT63058.1 hypothetical protein [Acidocella sp.]HQU04724.1 hypothetical protein [Acidocella sp.]
MRYVLILPVLLAACSLPGRSIFAPDPVAADSANMNATKAFAGRVPLVTILPGTSDFAGPVADAVKQALAIKPSAAFDVQATAPAGSPDAAAAMLAGSSSTAAAVARAIIADGVAPDKVSLTAATAGTEQNILVYVK